MYIKIAKQVRGSPGFHVPNHTQVVFVPPNSPLHLVEQVAQLHENHQARHGQPDIAKQLGDKNRAGIRNKHEKQEAASGVKRWNWETSPEEFLFCWVHSDQPCVFEGTTAHYLFIFNFGSTAFIMSIKWIQSCPD